MKCALLVTALILFAVPAYAKGMKVCFDDGSVADYKSSGAYEYTGQGSTSTGKWKALGGGQYLVNFDNGHTRVDRYEDAGAER